MHFVLWEILINLLNFLVSYLILKNLSNHFLNWDDYISLQWLIVDKSWLLSFCDHKVLNFQKELKKISFGFCAVSVLGLWQNLGLKWVLWLVLIYKLGFFFHLPACSFKEYLVSLSSLDSIKWYIPTSFVTQLYLTSRYLCTPRQPLGSPKIVLLTGTW